MMTSASKFSMKKIETVFAVSFKMNIFWLQEPEGSYYVFTNINSYAMKMETGNWITRSLRRFSSATEQGRY